MVLFLVFGLAICLAGFLYGIVLAIFRRGRRRRGIGIMAGAFVSFVTIALVGAEQSVKDEGWNSSADKQAAQQQGVSDPGEWATMTAAAAEAEQSAAAARAAEDRRHLQAAEAAAAEARKAAEREEIEARRIAAEGDAKEKRYGFHCLSGWDGSHRGFVSEVLTRLNDPDSFKHAETRTWPVRDDGRNQIVMSFRAKNGFGGMVLSKAVGTFDNASCDAVLDTID